MLDRLSEWAIALNDRTGLDLTILHDEFDRTRFLEGVLTTVELSALCVAFSVIIGIVGAWLQGSDHTWTRRIVQGYIQLFRNTPPLVQMYFFYFGVSTLLPQVQNEYGFDSPLISNFAWATISLSFFAGAFNVEIFRSGIEAVADSTREASEALGFSRLQTYRYVVLPLALRVCLPALNNNLVNLVKTTTLAYAIAVPELLYASNQIWSDSLNVPEMMLVLFLAYMLLVGLFVSGMNRWERRLRLPGFGR